MRVRIAAASAIVFAALLTGCASGGPVAQQPTSSEQPSSRPPFQTTTPGPLTPTSTEPAGTPTDVPAARWAAIEDDLARRGITGVVELVSAENVVFSDGSLGCPSPGQSYTQAQVDGMRVVVGVDGATYDYRFGQNDTLKLCTR
jgi:hypothetical protein